MDVTATLAVPTPPALDQDAADTRDPAVAAAFTAVLAGLMTTAPPAAATPTEGGSLPADGTGVTAPTPVGFTAAPVSPAVVPAVAPAVAPTPPGVTVTDGAPVAPVVSASPVAPAPSAPVAPDAGAAPVAQADPTGPPMPELSPPPPARPIAARGHTASDAAAETAAPTATGVAGRAAAAAAGPVSRLDGEAGAGDAPDARGTGEVPVAPDAIAPAPAARLTGAASPAPPAEPGSGRMVERALAAQVVHRVGRLVDDGDGHHELSLQLEPADLGRLELRVRLEAGVVHVHLQAQAPGTSDLLRQALPELRAALTEAGLSAGGLDIHDHSGLAGGGGGPANPHREPAGHAAADRRRTIRAADVRIPSPVVTGSGALRGVDVLL